MASNLSTTINKTIVQLVSNTLSNYQGDAFVNSTSTSLNLTGQISRSLLQLGGNTIKTECQNNYPDGINFDEVAITSAGNNLNISTIYHIALPSYQNDSKEDLLAIRNAVTLCLEQLEKDSYKKIGFPTLGCGGMGYPDATVAKGMFNAIQIFVDTYKNYESEINILVSNDQEERYKVFCKEFQNFENHNKPKTNTNFTNRAQFILSKHDIFQKQGDVFVNTTSTKLDLTGGTSKTLLWQGGTSIQSIQFKCRSKSSIGITYNNVAVTSVGTIQNYNPLVPYQYNINNDTKVLTRAVTSKAGRPIYQHYPNGNKHQEMRKYINRNINQTSLSSTINKKTLMLPTNWDNMNNDSGNQCFPLPDSCQEYNTIIDNFKIKLGKACEPTSITLERIQNSSLYYRYMLFKEQLTKDNGSPNEMTLYHGTNSDQHTIDNICRGGFKRNYTGKQGYYGYGVYFAENSEYSHNYTNKNGKCCMFVAKVAIGLHTLGNKSMTHPPINPATNKEFNSTTNKIQTIFATFDDSQSYPEYLITYYV